jgi:hypothetical protein
VKGTVRPLPGNSPHDRPVSRGFCFVKESLRLSLSRHLLCCFRKIPGRPGMRFLRQAKSIWSDVVQSQNQKPNPRRDPTASRRSAPHQVKERAGRIALLSHRPQMSFDRLFLDRVGRHQSPSPLHRHEQINMHLSDARTKDDISTLPRTRHFYFALTLSPPRLTSNSLACTINRE